MVGPGWAGSILQASLRDAVLLFHTHPWTEVHGYLQTPLCGVLAPVACDIGFVSPARVLPQRFSPKITQNKTCNGAVWCLVSALLFGERTAGCRRKLRVASERKFMAVKIRMKRIGAKNQPVFRIVVADGRSPRDGKFIEEIGTYWPEKKGDNVKVNLDRAKYWLSKGAQ